MIEIEKPRIERVDVTEDYGKYIVEPLERGYGITLGNSLPGFSYLHFQEPLLPPFK